MSKFHMSTKELPKQVTYSGGIAWVIDMEGDNKEIEITLSAGTYDVEEFHPYEPSAYVHEALFALSVDGAYITVPAYDCERVN